jgi:hypothetical protein
MCFDANNLYRRKENNLATFGIEICCFPGDWVWWIFLGLSASPLNHLIRLIAPENFIIRFGITFLYWKISSNACHINDIKEKKIYIYVICSNFTRKFQGKSSDVLFSFQFSQRSNRFKLDQHQQGGIFSLYLYIIYEIHVTKSIAYHGQKQHTF